MSQIPAIVHTSANNITVGFTMVQLHKWVEGCYKAEYAPQVGYFEDIPDDWLAGGLFLLAEAVGHAVTQVTLEIEDVFEYKYCTDDLNHSIWIPAVRELSETEWYHLCANNDLPVGFMDAIIQRMNEIGIVAA